MEWEAYSFVIASKRRKDIVLSLESELTPTQISKAIGLSIKNVSKLLLELKKKGLVNCLTPNARKGRLYTLSPQGKQILIKLKQMERTK